MAQKTQVLLTCDLEDGEKPASQTIGFSVEGSTYEIDLCDKHAKQFREAMASFIASGRRGSQAGARRRRSSGGGDRQRTQEIRAWARKKGIKVSERGRLSSDVVAKYEASGGR
ncbi:MAG TPA: Lsr2 family protein [Frankiaceae bacterium]|nr:Lsr2 family protein [Frankiaceae bacterium]